MQRVMLVSCLAATACANDPLYLACDQLLEASDTCIDLEAGQDDGTGMAVQEVKSSLLLPINLEPMIDAQVRAQRTGELGVDVPYVKVGDVEVSVEFAIQNLDDSEGIALIELNGATEFFDYDPDKIVLSTEDEAPETPPLAGNIPLHIPGGATLTGIFREDELREASIDIEQVTRANVNPFRAVLTVSKNLESIQPFLPFDPELPDEPPQLDPAATPIPREAFASLIRVDLVFKPDRHMLMRFNVRVRDVRGDLVNERALAAPADELQPFDIQSFEVGTVPGT
jgi:hypothetical protein